MYMCIMRVILHLPMYMCVLYTSELEIKFFHNPLPLRHRQRVGSHPEISNPGAIRIKWLAQWHIN